MEVVALVPDHEHVSTRYRIAQYAGHLERVGLPLVIEPLASATVHRVRQLSRRRSDQIVLLQRKLLPVWQLGLLRQAASRLVYDFDDAVYQRDSFHPRGPYSLTRAVRFAATVTLVDMVIAGNSYLADAAGACTAKGKIRVVPTAINPARYAPAHHADQRPTRLVWIGSSSTLRSLEEGRSQLESIGRAIPGMLLRVVCDRFPDFDHLQVEPNPWSAATETDALRGADIGISVLSDSAWSRGKCGLKVLQYMAAGLPVVASPVGIHADLVGAGQGFLPTTTEGWVEHVRDLARDPALRAQMGREGRERLSRHFHVDTWGPVLAEQLAEVASRT